MIPIHLSRKEKDLLVHLAEQAQDALCHNSCNDMDASVWKDWTQEDKDRFADEFHEYNGDPENKSKAEDLHDFCVLSLLIHKLRKP